MDATANMETLEQHLLFHKAMAEDEETFHRINGYLEQLKNESNGEKYKNEVDEAVRSVFSLVIEKGLDPWSIDIDSFTKLYAQRVSNSVFDIIVAGRLLYMAWKILNMQSMQTRTSMDEPVVEEFVDEGDFALPDEDAIFDPQITLQKAYTRDMPRTVEVIDILDAFEGVEEEVEQWVAAHPEPVKREPKPKAAFNNKAHEEDDETVVQRVYDSILAMGVDPMPISEFYTASKKDNITVFVSVLHLVRDGKLEISQETLPYGEIMVQIKQLPSVPLEIAAVN